MLSCELKHTQTETHTHAHTHKQDRHSWGYRGCHERGAIWCQQMELIKGGEEKRGAAANQDEKTKCFRAILKALISLWILSASVCPPYAKLYVSMTQDVQFIIIARLGWKSFAEHSAFESHWFNIEIKPLRCFSIESVWNVLQFSFAPFFFWFWLIYDFFLMTIIGCVH